LPQNGKALKRASLNYEEYKQKIVTDLEIDDETLQMLIDTFFDSTADDLNALRTLVKNQDHIGVSQKSHAIKGAASSMRFDEMANLLKQLELAAKEADDNVSNELFERIMLEFNVSAVMCNRV